MDNNNIVDSFNQRKREQEVALYKELRKAYIEIEDGLLKEADKVLSELPSNPGLAIEHKRVHQLLDQVREEMQKYADDYVRPLVAQGMVQSSYLGEEQSLAILRSVYPATMVLATLPTRAIDAYIKFLSTGPLGSLLDSFGYDASRKARRDLLVGLSLGQNPRKVARLLKRSLGTSLTRSFLIARTETMRAHREGNRQSYRNNPNLVTAWIWHASASKRTCAACWALHGREFPLEEPMNAHPACRCSMVPKTKTWREMGYDINETAEPIPNGEDMFAAQDETTQRAVLGNRQYERYNNGEVSLNDFVGTTNTQYGKTYVKKVPI